MISLSIWLAREELFADDAGLVGIAVATDAHRHDDFFERGVAGTLANAIDGALDLAGSRGNGGHGVGYRHAEIVVAVGRDSDVLDSLHAAANGCDQVAEFRRHGEADGIRNIERSGASFDHGFEHLAEKFGIGARGIFRRKFDVIAKRLGEANGIAGLRQALIARDAQLVLQVNVGSGEEDVDARAGSVFQSFPGALDIGAAGAGQSGDDGPADDIGDGLHGFEIAVRGDGKPGFDHIGAEAVELVSQAQLLLHGSCCSRATVLRRARWYQKR